MFFLNIWIKSFQFFSYKDIHFKTKKNVQPELQTKENMKAIIQLIQWNHYRII